MGANRQLSLKVTSSNAALKTLLERLRPELHERSQLRVENQELVAQVDRLSQDKAEVSERFDQTCLKAKMAALEATELRERSKCLSQQLTKLHQENEALTKHVDQLRAEQQSFADDLANMNLETQELRQEAKRLQKENDEKTQLNQRYQPPPYWSISDVGARASQKCEDIKQHIEADLVQHQVNKSLHRVYRNENGPLWLTYRTECLRVQSNLRLRFGA